MTISLAEPFASEPGIDQTQPPEFEANTSRTMPRKVEWLLLALVVFAALVMRLYMLDSFPDTLVADEADNAQAAVRILYDFTPANGFFGLDWTQQPAFSVYKGAAFIRLFGFNITAIRLPSALISTLALIPFYFLLRRQLLPIPSLLATILLATSVWYLNFSRSGWNNIDICFYMLMTMLFLVRGIEAVLSETPSRRYKAVQFALAGFFCALGLYGYPGGRAIILGIATSLPVVLWFHRKQWKTLLFGYVLLFFVTIVTFAPQGAYILSTWGGFNQRTGVVLIFNNAAYQADPLGTMLRQLERNILGFWVERIVNTPQYTPVNEPQLDRLAGMLTLLGMVLTFILSRFRRRYETWLWWLMLLSGWGLMQLLTVATPNSARGIGYLPALMFFAGVSLDTITRSLTSLLARISAKISWAGSLKPLVPAFLTVAILWAGYANIVHYVEWQNKPHSRVERHLYITTQEFPEWSATIESLAMQEKSMNVGTWRELHPIEDLANPHGSSPANEPP